MDDDSIGVRLAAVRRRIAEAESAAGRGPGEVRLLLATKTMPADVVRRALIEDPDVVLGENKVQELVAKAPALADWAETDRPDRRPPPIHLIGPLQSNKVNHALRWAACVQTVATVDLAQRLSVRCLAADRVLEVMVQVNVTAEASKSGVAPGAAADLAAEVGTLPGLRLTGFMTIGASTADQGLVRSGFARLREVRDTVVGSGRPGTADARELSMGMSGDLESAVAEGATIVRVGSAVFGARPPA